jgi:Zn-dependent protease/predicted transcriptional regulator
MKWSFRIGRFAGIDVFVHATFLLFLAWVGFSRFSRTGEVGAAIDGVLFMLAVFGTVVIHEFGHALMARRFGVQTRDVTLLPIGGVARLERIPERPLEELAVALAGPAVNVAFAVVFGAILTAQGIGLGLPGADASVEGAVVPDAPFLLRMFWVNVSLAVFNLLPAFPMDGGRALRALLATRGDHVQATKTAAGIGQGLALLLGLLGVFANPMLVLVAVFVWLGAASESQSVQVKHALAHVPVEAAMMTTFSVLQTSDTLATAARALLRGAQVDFPVVADAGAIVGVLPRSALIEGLARGGVDERVGAVMKPGCAIAERKETLPSLLARLQEGECPLVAVVERGVVVGVVTLENLGELLMVQDAVRRADVRRG